MNQPLDVFGQQAGLNRLYTQLCLCFSAPDTRRDQIVRDLDAGLRCLVESVPWLSGRVVFDDKDRRYHIRAAPKSSALHIKDLTDSLPTMVEIRKAGYPARLLDEKLIAPCETIRASPSEPATVFMVRANFVSGGLMLVLCGLHSCMDMAGLGHVTSLFGKACCDNRIDDDAVSAAKNRRPDAIPLQEEEEVRPSVPLGDRKRPTAPQSDDEPAATWSYILFSGNALTQLKHRAAKHVETSFVSTDDCLTTFLWQSITRARRARHRDGDTESVLTRTVDARKSAGMPATYTGNAAVKVAHCTAFDALIKTPIGAVASQLRRGLDGNGDRLRNDATLLSRGQTPPKVSVEPSTGVNFSSWAKEGTYSLDFGPLLGKPEGVRRPAFEAWESLVYLMPRREDGEIAAAVCLREDDTSRLKQDAFVSEYAHFVG